MAYNSAFAYDSGVIILQLLQSFPNSDMAKSIIATGSFTDQQEIILTVTHSPTEITSK